jgi:hypothetical protein
MMQATPAETLAPDAPQIVSTVRQSAARIERIAAIPKPAVRVHASAPRLSRLTLKKSLMRKQIPLARFPFRTYAFLLVKFRAKFGLDGCLWVLLGLFQIFSSLRGHFGLRAPGISLIGVATGLAIALVPLVRSMFLYWEFDLASFRERAFLRVTHNIPWHDITRVNEFIPGSEDDTLAVWYQNPKSKSGSSFLTARPNQRQQFLEALHKYAPTATIDVKRA